MAQLGRALGLGPRGCRFKSCFPDHLVLNVEFQRFFCVIPLVHNPIRRDIAQTMESKSLFMLFSSIENAVPLS